MLSLNRQRVCDSVFLRFGRHHRCLRRFLLLNLASAQNLQPSPSTNPITPQPQVDWLIGL